MTAAAPLTVDHAQDCARHFLGRNWVAWIGRSTVLGRLHYLGTQTEPNIHYGYNWEEAFAKAGVGLPPKPRFVGVGKTVRRHGTNEVIAHTLSKTMAQRVANALNEYLPGPKGY